MSHVTTETKRVLIERQLQTWRNTQYDAEVQVKVADAIDDSGMKETAVAQMQRAIRAIDVLEDLWAKLPPPTEAGAK